VGQFDAISSWHHSFVEKQLEGNPNAKLKDGSGRVAGAWIDRSSHDESCGSTALPTRL
jgi:hypothetical protein